MKFLPKFDALTSTGRNHRRKKLLTFKILVLIQVKKFTRWFRNHKFEAYERTYPSEIVLRLTGFAAQAKVERVNLKLVISNFWRYTCSWWQIN